MTAGCRAADAPVDVVVPVYNAAADLARCVESVLTNTTGCYRLVLIDDASTDPAIAALFEALRARAIPHLLLLRNETNLGFTGTANRGMQFSRADVVLLNSDTIVTRDWLDALLRCAASNRSFGTITPFSNNAEICSFPRFCENNGWSERDDAEPVRAALARAAVPTYPDLPTGVGFCMYVRRDLIDAIGVFDPMFGLGYGEENDFCLRGFAVGYRNVLCEDAFVLHLGGRSFEGQKVALGVRNLALLVVRHPHYEAMVRSYIAADPLRPLREAALSQYRAHTGNRRGVLHVIHGHGGGTEHHVRALIDASRQRYRHYLAIAVGDRWQVEEHLDEGAVRSFDLQRLPEESWAAFMQGVCASFRIGLVHLHNISGCREGLIGTVEALGLPYGYTVHDLNFACPTITFRTSDGMYCGSETDPARCDTCLKAQPAFAGVDIADWRVRHGRLLAGAAFIIAPSRWAAGQVQRYFADCRVDVIPHGAPGVWASQTQSDDGASGTTRSHPRMAVLLPNDDIPTVAVLGAIGPDKGARRIERMVELARQTQARVRFVLIGYLDHEQGPWQSDDARWTIHGRYDARDLPALLDHYRVRLVMFPSAGPETFSFTLSEAWAAGRPVIVPPIGALAERVQSTGAGWIWTEGEWRSEERMLASVLARLDATAEIALAAMAAGAARAPQPTLAAMAESTLALYERAMAMAMAAPDALLTLRPLAPVRIRDALGYAMWYPPAPAMPANDVPPAYTATALVPAASGPIAPAHGLLRAALRLRHTWLGRLLYALTPSAVRDNLRARLRS